MFCRIYSFSYVFCLPWGSWGYDKQSSGSDGRIHLGYTHTYAKRSDVSKVCVNFYDVHGGDKPGGQKFQLPNGTNEIDVLKNGDNSIETNKFLVNGGSCFSQFEEPNFAIKKEQRIAGEATYTKAKLHAEVGQTVEYTITVDNTGNTTLKFGPLSDPKCTNIKPPGATELKSGESETFTCEHTLVAADKPIYTNVATIEGGGKEKPSEKVEVEVEEPNFRVEKLQRINGAFTKDRSSAKSATWSTTRSSSRTPAT